MGCGSNGSLTDSLIDVVDAARGIVSDLGLRPQRVFLVWIGWTIDGYATAPVVREDMEPDAAAEAFSKVDLAPDEVGVGRPILLAELEVTPRPSVLITVSKDQDAVGVTERGTISVAQISMRYPEDLLMGLRDPFRDPKRPDALVRGVEFFWEVREDRRRGYVTSGHAGERGATQELEALRRRFHVASAPTREAGKFEWRVSLRRADGERGRTGDVGVIG